MNPEAIHEVISILKEVVKQWEATAVTIVSGRDRDPFKVLVSCILSLRTQDRTTAVASSRLFALADTPAMIAELPLTVLEQAIYPVGFYRVKSVQIRDIARGLVPDEIDELLKFRGVGRKTANLVVTLGYRKPGICVDTHVHRICNRWGYVTTKSPEQTEYALRAVLPGRYWLDINDWLVMFGQNLCTPVSPKCTSCPLCSYCDRVGVEKFR
jgi:endonuclease-3